jgi:hypothetical protein
MAVNNPKASLENLIGSSVPDGSGVNNASPNSPTDARSRRLGNLPENAVPTNDLNFVEANWQTKQNLDWRVRLSLPNNFRNSNLMTPLLETDGLMFPYTPQIVLEHQANYNALHPTHSNYPFPAYQNSAVSSMTIIGEFLVENAQEAAYWVAAVHYLRSVTKMAYGKTSNQGSPPPVVKLNGYGDYVFNNVPVTITYFSVDLPSDVDYMQVQVGQNGTWVPTRSQINVQAQPTYSRSSVTKFSLDKFISGEYVINKKGFI